MSADTGPPEGFERSALESRGSALQRLDERVVPRLQEVARTLVRAAGAPARALTKWEESLGGGRVVRRLWHARQIVLFVAAVIFVSASYVHFQRFGGSQDTPGVNAEAGGAVPRAAELPGTAGGGVAVGPSADVDPAAYVRERAAVLADADPSESRVAVVSFTRYLDAAETAAVIPGSLGVRALRLRVPANDQDPFGVRVEGDDVAARVRSAVDDVRRDVASEEAEVRELLESGTVDDEEYETFYREEVDRLAAIRSLLNSGGGVVYAAVLHGEVSALQELATHDLVRLVDLAPPEIDVAASTFEGLLPEAQATPRQRRPTPTVTPGGRATPAP